MFFWPEHWNVSHHAVQRWIERIGNTSDSWGARRLIQIAADNSIGVPNRLATRLWVPEKVDSAYTTVKRRHGFRYRLSGQAVLVMSGQTIITILKATAEDWATILVWQITGCWVDSLA